MISLDQHHDKTSTEISYQFMPHAWGKGYAFEVTTAVIDYAFKSLHLPYLVTETQTANHRSRKLLEKLNMEVTGTVQRFGESQHLYKLINKGGEQNE